MSITASPTSITPREKDAAQSIISVFETGKPLGGYGACTILPDGAGISYGKHQATDRSGSLDAIVLRYSDLHGSLAPKINAYGSYLAYNASCSVDPDGPIPPWCSSLMSLLRQAGDDKVMQTAQDQIFDELYWNPCASQCSTLELRFPLSWAVVYDSFVQSGTSASNPLSFPRIRRLFPEVPPVKGGDEEAWTKAYIAARRNALAGYVSSDAAKQKAVRSTVYRCDALKTLAVSENWFLQTPFTVAMPGGGVVVK